MSNLQHRVTNALAKVIDPELGLPITELGMVGDLTGDDSSFAIEVKLTVSHCPQSDFLLSQSQSVLNEEFGAGVGLVRLSVMTKEELSSLKIKLRGPEKANPFGPGSATRVVLVGSGKGGVGKSTITTNLAVSLSQSGYQVGLIDADIFGFSITNQLGITERPTRLDDMMLPPISHGVKVISIGMFLEGNEPVSWRGPMLHKAIEQFLTDVYWGQLDFLIIDMPPGTGDVAISIGQLLPNAKALVLTTAAQASALVAVRSGLAAHKAGHEIIGVVENMSWLADASGSRQALFGSGGGDEVAQNLSTATGYPVSLLSQIPISQALAESSNSGLPLVLSEIPDPATLAIKGLAEVVANTKLDKQARVLQVKLNQ